MVDGIWSIFAEAKRFGKSSPEGLKPRSVSAKTMDGPCLSN